MATPHVAGLAATLMEHFPEFRSNPALLRAHMMASTIAHDDVTGMSNDYGIGRVSGHLAHWAQPDAAGWSTHWSWGSVSNTNWHYRDITVPAGAQRLVVVLTWDEPAASAGASLAVTYDVDLYVDHLADCNEPTKGACGEWSLDLQHRQRRVHRRQQPAGGHVSTEGLELPGAGLRAARRHRRHHHPRRSDPDHDGLVVGSRERGRHLGRGK